jgi:hypothetical protein
MEASRGTGATPVAPENGVRYLVQRACGHATVGEGAEAVTRPRWEDLGEVTARDRAEAWEAAKQDLAALDGANPHELPPEELERSTEWCPFRLMPVSALRDFKARGRWVLDAEVEGL